MRETKFIEQNKNKWESFERIMRSDLKDPDKLSDLFIQLTDDLSYARTFYPNRSVRVYLNNKAQQIFYNLYKNKLGKGRRFATFWTEELPNIVYHARKELLFSFVIFTIAVVIGIVSSVNDPEFNRVILGDDYVEMTIANINSGDPMAVYKKMNEVDMFLGITLNNILVVFKTFILGILMAVGTVAILLYNGIMVGTFQYFFIEKGLFWDSFLTIWLHGTLEISAIIISGGAGLVLGKGFIFPGKYSRLQAFQISAIKGVKLLMGITPIIVFAAIIESFVTRYTDIQPLLKAGVIIFSLLFVVFYFIWLPYSKLKKGFIKKEENITPFSISHDIILEGRIKNNSEIFKDVFSFSGKYLRFFLFVNLILAVILVPVIIYYMQHSFIPGFSIGIWLKFNVPELFKFMENPIMFLVYVVIISVNLHFIILCLVSNLSQAILIKKDIVKWKHFRIGFHNTLLITSIFLSVFFLEISLSLVLFFLITPLLLMTLFIAHRENLSLISSLKRAFVLLRNCKRKLLGLVLLILLVGVLSYLLIESPIILFYYELLQWNLVFNDFYLQNLYYGLNLIITLFFVSLLFSMLMWGSGILYFTLIEINEAVFLKEKIKRIGERI